MAHDGDSDANIERIALKVWQVFDILHEEGVFRALAQNLLSFRPVMSQGPLPFRGFKINGKIGQVMKREHPNKYGYIVYSVSFWMLI